MEAKLFESALSAVVVSIGLVGSAFAAVENFDIRASGLSFGNQATATGFIIADTAVPPIAGVQPVPVRLSPAVFNLGLTILGAAAGEMERLAWVILTPLYFWRQAHLILASS